MVCLQDNSLSPALSGREEQERIRETRVATYFNNITIHSISSITVQEI